MAYLILLKLTSVVLFLYLTGFVLINLILQFFFKDEFKNSRENFFITLFASLPFLAVVLQYLAWLNLLNIWVFVIFWIFFLTVRRKDIGQFFKSRLVKGRSLAKIWNPQQFVKYLIFLIFGYVLLENYVRILIPSTNVDVFYYHIPIAKKIALEHGFNLPLHNHPYYANQPAFSDFIYSLGFLFQSDYRIAHAINYSIFVTFLFLLLNLFAKRSYYFLGLIPILLIFSEWIFLSGALNAMNDTTRACFGVSGILILIFNIKYNYKYLYFLVGVLIGCDVASKYLGLVPMFLAFLLLIWNFIKHPNDSRFKTFILCLGFASAIGPWYLKNLILYMNPIYPYVFGHPGLTDRWMEELMIEQTKAFDPAHRIFKRNLFEFESWKNFLDSLRVMFFQPAGIILSPILGVAVLLVRSLAIRILLLLSISHFIIWYFFIFNSARFGISAYLIFLCALVVSFIELSALAPRKFSTTLVSLILFLIFFFSLKDELLTLSSNNLLRRYLVSDIDEEKFMSSHFDDYSIMKYISSHRLTNLWTPLGNDLEKYISFLFVLENKVDFVGPHGTPSKGKNICEFLTNSHIKYFITKKHVSEIDRERLDSFAGEGYVFHVQKALKNLEQNSVLLTESENSKLFSLPEKIINCKSE